MRTIVTVLAFVLSLAAKAQGERFTIVELNVENLFDTRHDSLKNDLDFLPDSLSLLAQAEPAGTDHRGLRTRLLGVGCR